VIAPRWYVDFFGEEYLRIYSHALTEERTQREADQLVGLLDLPPGSDILDLCCGHGRHAIALAERGYQITGQDLNAFFLEKAEAEATTAGVEVRFIRSDMRRIPFENRFDAVINMFSAFGYLESQEDDQAVLKQVEMALKPGGLFLMETIHQAWLVRNFEPRGWHVGEDDIVVLEERELDLLTGRNQVTVTLIRPDGSRQQQGHAMRIYTAAELIRMVRQADLEIKEVYGGLDRSALSLDARRVVLLAQKPSVSADE